jgi:hypothetical protein
VLPRLARAALAFALAGAVAALPFILASESRAENARLLALPVLVAASTVGAACWGVLCTPQATRGRAIVAGVLFGISAHIPVMFLLALTVGEISGLPALSPNIGGIIGMTLFFAFFSLLSYGWLTVTLGVLTGLALERLEARAR